jgi:hypothetical protein
MITPLFVNVEFAIDRIHFLGIDEDQRHKNVNGSLLGKPEAQRVTAQVNIVEEGCEQDTCTERNQEPNCQYLGQQTQRSLPIGSPLLSIAVLPYY